MPHPTASRVPARLLRRLVALATVLALSLALAGPTATGAVRHDRAPRAAASAPQPGLPGLQSALSLLTSALLHALLPGPSHTVAAAGPQFGVNWHAGQQSEEVRSGVAAALERAGVRLSIIDFSWDSLEHVQGQYTFDRMDQYVNEAAAHGIKVVVLLYWPPAWASTDGQSLRNSQPKDPAAYGEILGRIGKRYGAEVPAVEMWNEPNLTEFWASGSAQQFAALLKGAYPVAKRISPSTTFVAGAPTYFDGNDGTWYQQLYAAGFKGSYDALGIHPYMAPSDLPPWAPASTWSIKGIGTLTRLMASEGDSTVPIWATEFGWSTHANAGHELPWKRGVTEDQQAEYLFSAMREFQAFPQLKVALWYTEKDDPTVDAQNGDYGLLHDDLSPKPSYFVAAALALCGC